MKFDTLTEEMKRYERFVVCTVICGWPNVMEPTSLTVYNSPIYADCMSFREAKKHIEILGNQMDSELYLGLVDLGGNLLVFDMES